MPLMQDGPASRTAERVAMRRGANEQIRAGDDMAKVTGLGGVFLRARDPKKLAARVRAEMHRVLFALARKEWEDATLGLWDPDRTWTGTALEEATTPLFAEHGGIDTTPQARASSQTILKGTGPRQWEVTQRLLGKDGDDLWMLAGVIDLTSARAPDAPLVELQRIGT